MTLSSYVPLIVLMVLLVVMICFVGAFFLWLPKSEEQSVAFYRQQIYEQERKKQQQLREQLIKSNMAVQEEVDNIVQSASNVSQSNLDDYVNNDSNYLSNSNTLVMSRGDFQEKLRQQLDYSYALQQSISDKNGDLEINVEIANFQQTPGPLLLSSTRKTPNNRSMRRLSDSLASYENQDDDDDLNERCNEQEVIVWSQRADPQQRQESRSKSQYTSKPNIILPCDNNNYGQPNNMQIDMVPANKQMQKNKQKTSLKQDRNTIKLQLDQVNRVESEPSRKVEQESRESSIRYNHYLEVDKNSDEDKSELYASSIKQPQTWGHDDCSPQIEDQQLQIE